MSPAAKRLNPNGEWREEGMSQTEVARELGVSRARVGQIEKSAIRKLRLLRQRCQRLQIWPVLEQLIAELEE